MVMNDKEWKWMIMNEPNENKWKWTIMNDNEPPNVHERSEFKVVNDRSSTSFYLLPKFSKNPSN